jgi:hypothetical protein
MSIESEQSFLSYALPRAREARSLVKNSLVQQGKMVSPEPLFSYGAEFGVSGLLGSDGSWVQVEPQYNHKSFWELTHEELESLLVERLEPVDVCVNPSLNKPLEYGFNDHKFDNHVQPVASRAKLILDTYFSQPGVEQVSILGMDLERDTAHKVLLIMSLSHDLGNVLSRSLHPLIGFEILKRRLPEINPVRILENDTQEEKITKLKHNTLARVIRRGIQLHDEKLATRYIDSLSKQSESGEFTLNELMLDRFGVLAIALLCADKSHAVDASRLPDYQQSDPAEALAEDWYITISAMAKSGEHQFNDREVKRTLTFASNVEPAHPNEKCLAQYCVEKNKGNDNRRRIHVPKEMYEIYHASHVPQVLLWYGETVRLNLDRIDLEATGLFALNPNLDTFSLEVVDSNPWANGAGGMTITLHLDRNTYKTQLNCLAGMFPIPLSVPHLFSTVVADMRDKLKTGTVENFHSFHDGICGIEIALSGSEENREKYVTYLKHLFMNKQERKGLNGSK